MIPYKDLKKNKKSSKVYRGGTNVFGLEKSFSKPTFVSVSLDRKIALIFINEIKKCCLYEYEINNDVLVLNIPKIERYDEEEILIHPNSYFEYVNKTTDDELTTYHYRVYSHLHKPDCVKYNDL
jgi:hypothetical protein